MAVSVNPKIAAHRLHSLADMLERGEIDRVLAEPTLGLSPEFRLWLKKMLAAADPRGLAGEIEAGG